MLVKQDQRLNCYKFDWSKSGLLPSDWSDIYKHMTMTFETDMMSCDPDLLVFWCMAHALKVFGV